MFTKRIAAYLAASGLALGGLLAAAGPAGASTRTPPTTGATIGTTAQAGELASGRNFRYDEGTVTVPDISSFINGLYPAEYFQLSNGAQLSTAPILSSGDQYVRAGIVSCTVASNEGDHNCPNGGWTAFVTTFSNGLGGGTPAHFFPLSVNAGDGVNFSLYYDAAGQDVHIVINPPNTTGNVPSYTYEESVPGALFDHAGVLDDFSDSYGHAPVQIQPFLHAFRINQFLNVALTTYSGAKGSLVGPWTTSEVEATSNGLVYPQGTVRVSPNGLFSDGLSGNGAVRSDDAVGVWAR